MGMVVPQEVNTMKAVYIHVVLSELRFGINEHIPVSEPQLEPPVVLWTLLTSLAPIIVENIQLAVLNLNYFKHRNNSN